MSTGRRPPYSSRFEVFPTEINDIIFNLVAGQDINKATAESPITLEKTNYDSLSALNVYMHDQRLINCSRVKPMPEFCKIYKRQKWSFFFDPSPQIYESEDTYFEDYILHYEPDRNIYARIHAILAVKQTISAQRLEQGHNDSPPPYGHYMEHFKCTR
jgi:hypothetical protein